MALNAHDLSVALFVRGLANLKCLLTKGEAHAASNAMDPLALIDAQLAPGMYSLAVQVHWAVEGAKMAVNRLIGKPSRPVASEAKSFAALYRQIDDAIAYLESLATEDLDAELERAIEIEHRGGTMKFVGGQFLLEFAIPSFFFHVTTAYGILRHNGVEVTKGDFLGDLESGR